MDYSKLTLGELLSSQNETIKRNAISILKQVHKDEHYLKIHDQNCVECRKDNGENA